MRLQKQKQTLYKLTKQKLGDCTWNGTRLESDEALDEERRQNVEQLSGFKNASSRNQFGISSVASGCQRNGQLHSSDLLQTRLPGSLQVKDRKLKAGLKHLLQVEELHCSGEDRPHDQRPGKGILNIMVMTSLQDSVFQLFQRVENKHGWMLVVPCCC